MFVDNDGNYFLIGVGKVNCKKNSAIVDQVLDEIYKYTNEINVTILIVPEEVYSNISTGNYKKITEMMNFRGA
ncbi:hypothetical protein SUSAZ_03990 [Sulfolobus acidocaldarius SUSAZ]|nr:hypothetical protein SUSAZ_03990 [Sulfolobus acidocaldarius SUSAZ]